VKGVKTPVQRRIGVLAPFRLAAPEDVATAVEFFASDEADYITGQTLSVSGGLTMM
jgi:NAD(P)-dependent dehydrogenase (short-subunit alcohol dehydrogenase family)